MSDEKTAERMMELSKELAGLAEEMVPEEFRTNETTCTARDPSDRYVCTRKAGHTKDHVAMGEDYPSPPVARWSQEPSPAVPPCPECASLRIQLADAKAAADQFLREKSALANALDEAARRDKRWQDQVAEVTEKLARMRSHGRCIWCGCEGLDEHIREHILTCPEHPMREVETALAKALNTNRVHHEVNRVAEQRLATAKAENMRLEGLLDAIPQDVKDLQAEVETERNTEHSGRLEALALLGAKDRQLAKLRSDYERLDWQIAQQSDLHGKIDKENAALIAKLRAEKPAPLVGVPWLDARVKPGMVFEYPIEKPVKYNAYGNDKYGQRVYPFNDPWRWCSLSNGKWDCLGDCFPDSGAGLSDATVHVIAEGGEGK